MLELVITNSCPLFNNVYFYNKQLHIVHITASQLTLEISGKSESGSGNFSRNLATYVMIDLSSGLSTSTSVNSATGKAYNPRQSTFYCTIWENFYYIC